MSGEKCYVPLGAESPLFLVVANAANGTGSPHPQALIVPRDTPGLTVGAREQNMGLKALETTGLGLDVCRVPRENLLGAGHADAMPRLTNLWRVALASMAPRAAAH